ncbi:MAG: pentapeptide repeat-containing protein [Pseudomonadota bacterium]
MTKEHSGIRIEKPVSVWNQPLRIRPRETFSGLAKAAINGAKGEMDDALEGLVDAFVDTDVDDNAGHLAWTLIYAALMRAVGDVLADALDLFETAQIDREAMPSESGQPNEAELESLSGILEEQLHDCEATIDAAFFDRPERFTLLDAFRPGFEHWLTELGMDETSSRGLGLRLLSQFPLALHEEWRRWPERFEPILHALRSPFAAAQERERQWQQYRAWLDAQVDQRMFGEAFGLRQVYVPLRAYVEESRYADVHHDDALPRQGRPVHPPTGPDRIRHVYDLHHHLRDWAMNFDSEDNVRVVSGGPGSGKSSFARVFAAEIAADLGLKVLFIPLHMLQIRDDLVHAVGRYAETDRWLRGNPIDGNGEIRLLVIFDGLDELSMQGASAAEAAQSFVEQVVRLAGQFSSQKMKRQFLITGRDLSIQANAGQLRRPAQVLHVLPFLLDRKEKQIEYHDPDGLLEADQRDHWWQRYGQAIGQAFEEMPEELSGEDLTEITRQPLLNYLVALSRKRGKVAFDAGTDLNQIYADLLEAVFERQYEGRRHAALTPISFADFERLLEEIALATWHGNGRTATDTEISERCYLSGLGPRLDAFRQGAEKGVTRLLTAFYFRQANQLGGERTFEFTHKSFGEYLTARRLVRALQRVQTQLDRRAEEAEDGWDARAALKHLAEVAGPTALDDYIDAFLRREIASQDRLTCEHWQRSLARLIEASVTHGLPMEELATLTYPEMARRARNSDEALLVMHSACATVTEIALPIQWPEPTSFGTWLKQLQGQREHAGNRPCQRSLNHLALRSQLLHLSDLYGANLTGADLTHTWAAYVCCSTADLHQANLSEADMNGANLSAANLIEADLDGANLSEASLNGAYLMEASLSVARLSEANLRRADLSSADLSGADLSGADLYEAGLIGADLRGADLTGASLIGTYLNGANLSGANLSGADLSGADLSGADLSGADLSEAELD